MTVDVTRNNASAAIAVSDDGPGIPVGEHQNVFRRFYRLERSRCTPGNGLGLSVVAAVARLHEARIKLVENAPGLKVELRFPLAEDPDEKRKLQAAVAMMRNQGAAARLSPSSGGARGSRLDILIERPAGGLAVRSEDVGNCVIYFRILPNTAQTTGRPPK